MCRRQRQVGMDRVNARGLFMRAIRICEGSGGQWDTIRQCYTRIFAANHNNHYFALSSEQPGKISYSKSLLKKYDTSTRIRTTIGRYLNRQLPEITDGHEREVDRFTKAWLSLTQTASYELVSGDDIVDAYREGFGGRSCMTGSASENVAMYAIDENPVRLLKFTDGDFEARALVWNTDEDETIVDRIYPNDGYHVDAIHRYAESQGWWWRESQSLPCDDIYFIRNGDSRCDFTVKLDHDGVFPYLDSFHYGTLDSNGYDQTASLSTERLEECFKESYGKRVYRGLTFDSCGGETPSSCTCHDCGDAMNEDDAYGVGCDNEDRVCESCYESNYFYCEDCSETYHNDSMNSAGDRLVCDGCLNDYYTQCDGCSEHAHNDDIATVIVEHQVSGENRRYEDQLCPSCCEDSACHCECCDELFSSELSDHDEEGNELDGPHCNECLTELAVAN